MTLTPAIQPDLAPDEYRKAPGISKTGLDRIAQSPAHYKAYLEGEFKETPALRFGRVAHMAILEPERFAVEVVQEPDIPSKVTKEGKKRWAEFQEIHKGCTIIKAEDMNKIKKIRESILAHDAARKLLDYPGKSEVSYFWKDPETGQECKCRVDYVRADGILVDFKTTEDASPRTFTKAVANFRYHVQDAFYSDGVGLTTLGPIKAFVFLVAEKSPPFGVATYILDPYAVMVGRKLYQRDLRRYAECMESQSWPAYSEKIEPLTLPGWAEDPE